MLTLIPDVLAAWRNAQRLAESLPTGTAEHAAAVAARDRLHDLYLFLTHPEAWQTPTTPAAGRDGQPHSSLEMGTGA